jgi:hypothetical protein
MDPKIISTLATALKRAADQEKTLRNHCICSVPNEKIVANLCSSSQYCKYVKGHFINGVAILMNNNNTTLYSEISKLSNLSIGELRQVWKEKFGKDAPYSARKTMLLDKLVYHFREQAVGGMSYKAKERLALLNGRLKKGEPLLGKNYDLAPGMIFIREYNDEKHTVKILDDGKVEYRGEIYRSLSTVASKICGCRWNGYKFFHVTKSES